MQRDGLIPLVDGGSGPLTVDGQPVKRSVYGFHRFTETLGRAGHPSLTLPCGFTGVGQQVIGPHHAGDAAVCAAAICEHHSGWRLHRRHFTGVWRRRGGLPHQIALGFMRSLSSYTGMPGEGDSAAR